MSDQIAAIDESYPERDLRIGLWACIVVPLAFGMLSLALGQDANWDLKNYHWYNPYAFLTERWAQDIAPAHVPTFYNPTLDVPFALLAEAVPARVAGFVLGLAQGLNFVLLYVLAHMVLARAFAQGAQLWAVAIALVGMVGGGHLGLVGTTFYDNIVSLFILGSLCITIAGRSWEAAARGARKPWLWLALGGVAVGAAAGLKLPTVIFCVGLCGAFLFVGPGGWVRVARSFVFGLGVLVGIGLFAGHWMVFLWDSFGNPIFPYFNELFGSSMGLAQDYRDTRFVPDNWLAAIFYPVFFAFDAEKVGEVAFRDFRILLAYTTLALLPMLWVAARGRIADRVELLRDGAAYVLIAVWLSYAVWLALFGIYRYLIPAEFIAPLLIVLTLALWPIPARVWRIASAGVLAFVTVSAWPATWGRVPWGDKFVEVTAPVIERPERAMVLLAGFSPTAWVIPAFPREASFLRIVGFGIEPAHGDTGINRQIRERIVSHDGDFYVLALEPERAYAAEVLSTFGLTLDADNCRPTPTNFGPGPELCAVSRLPDQASQESDNV